MDLRADPDRQGDRMLDLFLKKTRKCRIGNSYGDRLWYGRDYRVGYALGMLDTESLGFELGVDAHRRESPLEGGADAGVRGRVTLGW